MDWIQIAGHTGALLSSITFIPQAYKAWVSKSVGDLSFSMLIIVFSSTIVWIIYGVSLSLLPVILCNCVIAVVSLTLIYFKLTFRKKYTVGP